MPGSPSWARRARPTRCRSTRWANRPGAGTDHVRSRKPEQGQGDDHRGRRRPLGQGRDRRRPRLDRERDAGLPPGRLIMEPRSGQGRAGAMAFALFAGAFRLLAWINGGAALVLVFFMLGVIGSDVAAPDLAPLRCTWRVSWRLRRSAVRLAGAGQPVATGRHPAARPAALAGPGAGRAFLCRERAVLLRRLLAGRWFRRHGRCLGDDGLHRRLENTGKPVCAKVLDLHLR